MWPETPQNPRVYARSSVPKAVPGSLLSAWLRAREEDRRWERQKALRNYDERRRAYVDLSRASSHLYREIGVIDAQLDPLVNKYLVNKYDSSEAKRTRSEAKKLWARVKDNVNQDLMSAFTAEEEIEIKLLSDDENVKSAARELYKACANLEPAAQRAVLRSFEKMDEPEKAAHQSDQYKTVMTELKEQYLAKYGHFMNIGREDLYR